LPKSNEFAARAKAAKVAVEYPIGRRRRHEGIPLLEARFARNLDRRFPKERSEAVFGLCSDQERLEATPVREFVDLFVI
jgi:2-methylcitrate dehydratase